MHRILVVDDEPASLRAVQRTLADEAEVVTAGDGDSAWAVLAQGTVALVVADQRMPDMLGTELFARTTASYPLIVRVLLTGYTDTETLLDAINAGHVFYYLTKPWTAAELRLVVRRGLERYDAALERQRLYAELEHACTQLRREAKLKGRLLTLAAHELGTPLHLAGSALELLEAAEVSAAQGEWLAMARRNLTWLGRGLSQMLAAGRWRQQPLALGLVSTDPLELLQRVRDRFGCVGEVRRLEWSWQIPASLPRLEVDPTWLERAVSNLVSNAVRFTADGGSVEISATVADRFLRICVADSGIGVPAALQAEIFEPFAGASGDLLLHGSGLWDFGARGLGLGLATAKAIVVQHGGDISLESREGQGSRFTICLPLHGEDGLAR